MLVGVSTPELNKQIFICLYSEKFAHQTLTLSLTDAHRALSQINAHRAAGPDGIPGHVLRTCAEQLARGLHWQLQPVPCPDSSASELQDHLHSASAETLLCSHPLWWNALNGSSWHTSRHACPPHPRPNWTHINLPEAAIFTNVSWEMECLAHKVNMGSMSLHIYDWNVGSWRFHLMTS